MDEDQHHLIWMSDLARICSFVVWWWEVKKKMNSILKKIFLQKLSLLYVRIKYSFHTANFS